MAKKRFGRQMLARFVREGRGTGTYQTYIPWHQVRRSDPSSRGRSHLIAWRERHIELLSDLEWIGCCFALMMPSVIDVREQFPLAIESSSHELCAYDVTTPVACLYPGTGALAREFGIKHPMVHDEGVDLVWTMTTDLLLTIREPGGQCQLIAIACKYDKEIDNRRTHDKLLVEATYWQRRKVRWLLFTPRLYDELVALTLRRSFGWFTGPEVTAGQRRVATAITQRAQGRSLTGTLCDIASQLGDMSLAQRAFWKCVWQAEIPLDLHRGWRPHAPINLLCPNAFAAQNPIASKRSSWTS